MNKKAFIPAIILILAAAAAYWWWQLKPQENPDAQVLYGNVDVREVRLAFAGSEHVDSILVEEGDRVTAGQLLATLHGNLLQAQRKRLVAEFAAAKAEAHAAELSYQRIARLAKKKMASQDDADVTSAKAKVAAARVEAAQAALDEIDEHLKDTELRAPQAGIIRERIVEEGDFVTPQTPILTLSLTNPVWVRTYIPETLLGRIKPGQTAAIHTDSYPDKVYNGWVGHISPTAEFTPKSVETPELRTRLVYQMRVYTCNPNNELLLGMPVTVTLPPDATNVLDDSPDAECGQIAPQPPADSQHPQSPTLP